MSIEPPESFRRLFHRRAHVEQNTGENDQVKNAILLLNMVLSVDR